MKKKFIIGIDLGGTNLKIGLFNLSYKLLRKQVLDTRAFKTKEGLLEALVDAVRDLLSRNRLSREEILGVGLGLPGPIDAERGMVHFFPHISGWKKVFLKRILSRRLRLPVFLDNDAKVMSLAEYELGAARNSRLALCITLGTGVGGAIVVNGQILRGVGNAAGEIGHLPLNETGPACACGGKGCLEAYIGNNRILARANKIYKRKISLEKLSALAGKHDQRALRIWSETGAHLGVALAAVTNLLNPDRIVIGGGVANAGRVLFDTVRKVLAERAMPVQGGQVSIVKARLGQDAGMIGAAILVKRGQG